MNIVITGAGGFVGAKLAQKLAESCSDAQLTLMDLQFSSKPLLEKAGVRYVEGELQSSEVQEAMLAGGVDVLYHLAALPGGASEANPELSKRVNLDATLSLFQLAVEKNQGLRIVYTSTIAVLGPELPKLVDDDVPVSPAMVYGCHKAMIELALADMHRRGLCEAVAIRLPGVVARPPAPSGLKSAFMSDVFHSLKDGQPFISPVSAGATFWIMSVEQCVRNLTLAGLETELVLPASRVVTLPALRVGMGDLIAEIQAHTGASSELVSFEPDPDLELAFGSYPLLATDAADRAGFVRDDDVKALVKHVFMI
jgi:nucleoside-diphosphate-sugar epimerase